jgi:hypothetical protein
MKRIKDGKLLGEIIDMAINPEPEKNRGLYELKKRETELKRKIANEENRKDPEAFAAERARQIEELKMRNADNT